MKVYLVEEGVYSHRRIIAVFLNKEKAEYFSEYHCQDVSEVLEFDTSDDDYEICVNKISYFNIVMDTKGTIVSIDLFTQSYSPSLSIDTPSESFGYDSVSNLFVASIVAESEDIAIKVAHDKRAQWLAEKFGI